MHAAARDLFRQLADLPPEERHRILAEPHISPELRAEVESLLKFDNADTDLLAASISEIADEVLRSAAPATATYCGPYRLGRRIGSGGMGAVYLAERDDGEIHQTVAIKLLHADGDRPAWRERFLRERQLLAYLNHPSIARLLDAGHTSDGRPYLAMECVDGASIAEYAAGLDLRSKLKLFLAVCDGVAHAHRHLIIHRDLKPSNILVDASGQPKLLDFGIAKLLDLPGDETRTVERLLTPNYASPEQLRGAIQTTATDIYSLGAVLYRLLTGKSPHEATTQSRTRQDTSGTRPLILPSRMNSDIPRDLDYVLSKALREEPEERYASVDALGNDIRAFLDSRPVEARAGDVWYRTRKFMRRYWIPVAAVVLAVTGLAAGFFLANRARAVAERRFEEVRQLSSKLFDVEREVRRLPGATRARQFIVDTSLDYLGRLAKDAPEDPELALDLGSAYLRVARVQGVPITSNLGQVENAEKNLRIAEGLIQATLKVRPTNRMAMLRAAQIVHDRMVLAQGRNPNTEALPLARESEAWLQKYFASGPVHEVDKDQPVIAGMNIANWYVRTGHVEDGLRLLKQTIQVAEATNQPGQAAATQIVMARALRTNGDLEGALAAIEKGLRTLNVQDAARPSPRTLRVAMALQGEILGEDAGVSLGRTRDAVSVLERSLALAKELTQRDAQDTDAWLAIGMDTKRLGNIVRHRDPRRAIALYDEGISALQRNPDNPRAQREHTRLLIESSYPLHATGQTAEAARRLDRAATMLEQEKLLPATTIELWSETDAWMRARAEMQASAGRPDEAIATYQELLIKVLAAKPEAETSLDDAISLSNLFAAMARSYRAAGRREEAAGLDARRTALWEHWMRKLPGNAFVNRQMSAARTH